MGGLRPTAATRQRLLNCLQRLYLVFPLLRRTGAANGFHSCTTPVETSTTPLVCLTLFSFYYYKHTAFGLSSPKLFLRRLNTAELIHSYNFQTRSVRKNPTKAGRAVNCYRLRLPGLKTQKVSLWYNQAPGPMQLCHTPVSDSVISP